MRSERIFARSIHRSTCSWAACAPEASLSVTSTASSIMWLSSPRSTIAQGLHLPNCATVSFATPAGLRSGQSPCLTGTPECTGAGIRTSRCLARDERHIPGRAGATGGRRVSITRWAMLRLRRGGGQGRYCGVSLWESGRRRCRDRRAGDRRDARPAAAARGSGRSGGGVRCAVQRRSPQHRPRSARCRKRVRRPMRCARSRRRRPRRRLRCRRPPPARSRQPRRRCGAARRRRREGRGTAERGSGARSPDAAGRPAAGRAPGGRRRDPGLAPRRRESEARGAQGPGCRAQGEGLLRRAVPRRMRVGIDLGTTYSLVAEMTSRAGPRSMPDCSDPDLVHTPSAVHITAESNAFVGTLARRCSRTTPRSR